jgi:Ca2+-transporting ATPase
MEVAPRPKAHKIIPRRLMTWLVCVGLLMAAGTLGVMAWATTAFPSENGVIAQTMGVTTFALFRLFSSLETADEDESLFGGSILANRPLLIATGLSVATIILATELGFLQRFLGMASLTGQQWLVCVGVSLSLIVVEEVRKLLKVRTGDEPVASPALAVA